MLRLSKTERLNGEYRQQDEVSCPGTKSKARFERRATAVPNSIDRIKFDFSTAVVRRLKPSRATSVPNSIHK